MGPGGAGEFARPALEASGHTEDEAAAIDRGQGPVCAESRKWKVFDRVDNVCKSASLDLFRTDGCNRGGRVYRTPQT